jgi:hypothetical protein
MSQETTDAEKAFATLDGLTSFMDNSEVEGHAVKEWSTTQFTRLYPYLSAVTTTLIESGASFSNLKSYLGENWPKLVEAVMPHLPQIIMISCPSVTQEVLDSKPFTFGLMILMAIFKRNMDHVADFFALKAGQNPVSPVENINQA